MKLKTTSLAVMATVFSLTTAPVAFATDGAALYQSKTCWSCHGKDAKTPIMPVYPILTGQNAGYALQQMKDIKSGVRSNGQSAAMKGVMGLVNDEEMKAIADWLSTLK